jgi:hypothetical protein
MDLMDRSRSKAKKEDKRRTWEEMGELQQRGMCDKVKLFFWFSGQKA